MSYDQDSEIILQTPKFCVLKRNVFGRSDRLVYVVEHPGSVAILPILDDGGLVLVRNLRPAIGKELFEIPAGTLKPGETPQAGAIRELAEETGYRARVWEEITQFYVSPGITNERMTLYFARELLPGQAHPEPDENLRVEVLTPEECRRAMDRGIICDAKSLIALLIFFGGQNAGENRI